MGQRNVKLGIILTFSFLWTACGGIMGGTDGTPTVPPPTETSKPAPFGTITRTDSDCVLDLAQDPINAGNVAITVINQSGTPTTFDLWRIGGGHTFAEFADHVEEQKRLAEEGEQEVAAPAYVEDLKQFILLGGESDTRVKTLTPGTYGVVCYQEFPDVGLRPYTLIGPFEVE